MVSYCVNVSVKSDNEMCCSFGGEEEAGRPTRGYLPALGLFRIRERTQAEEGFFPGACWSQSEFTMSRRIHSM